MYILEALDTAALIELLAKSTVHYTNKLAEKGTDLSQLEYEISLIQSELNKRKMSSANNYFSESSELV